MDDYSLFPEAEIVAFAFISAKTVIQKLDSIFAHNGIPETTKSDSGAPFNGEDFW